MMDKLETIRQYLTAAENPLLTFLGGPYVAVDRVPQGFDNTHPLVVLTQETGGGHVTGADFVDVVMCRCYGGTANNSDARAVFRAVYDRFFSPGCQVLAAGKIKQAFYVGDLVGPDDPITGWPTHVGRFQIALEE